MAAQGSSEDILAAAGLLSPAQAEAARKSLAERKLPPQHLPQAVVELGFAAKTAVLEALSKVWLLPFEDLDRSRLDPVLMESTVNRENLVPFDLCRQKLIAPLYCDESLLILACAEPLDPFTMDSLQLRTAREIRYKLALAGEIVKLMEPLDPDRPMMVGPGSDVGSIIKRLLAEGKIEEAGELKGSGKEVPSVFQVLWKSQPPVVALSHEQLERATRYAYEMEVDILEAVIRLGFASKEAILDALSKSWGAPAVDFDKEPASLERVRLLRTPFFTWESVLPFDERGGELCLAMRNPLNRLLIEHIEEATGRKVAPYLALAQDILRVIRSLPA